MPVLNHQRREVNCKVVYYGTGMGGKTTNLQYIHSQVAPSARGELISMATNTDRTLFFDMLPLDLCEVKGWQVRLSLFTVPGQVEYNASRKLILNGVDAIVFVADSEAVRAADNVEAMQNMFSNLSELGIKPQDIPYVLQYNKRDLPSAMPTDLLEKQLNVYNVMSFESIAVEGLGVFSTMRAISKLLIEHLSQVVG